MSGIKRTTEQAFSHLGLPGGRRAGEPYTNPNEWVADHIRAVLDMSPEEAATMDRLTPEWISKRLELLGGTGQPLETRLFIEPASKQSSGKGLGDQAVILSKVGLTHARSNVVNEDGSVNKGLLDKLVAYAESKGGKLGAKELNRFLNEQIQPFKGGEIKSFGLLERLATRLAIAPVEWGLLLSMTGGEVTTKDLKGLYDHSLFPRLRAERAAVRLLDGLKDEKLLSKTKHGSGALGPDVQRLTEWAGGVAQGEDPVSVAKSTAQRLLADASESRLDALASPQGFPVGRVGLATMRLLCPFGGASAVSSRTPSPALAT
jgi:hypothetical protein